MYKALTFSIRLSPKSQDPWELIPSPQLPVGIQAWEVATEFWLVWGFLKSLEFGLKLGKAWWLLALEKQDEGA